MKRNRQDRRTDFDEFYHNSKEIFTELRDADPNATKFEQYYMLCICPGSRNNGTNKRIVEVFWGANSFEVETEGRNWRALTEKGATLHFERDDNGFIIITLYPACTENRKPVETSITLHIWLDTKKLKSKRFLNQLWKDFMAYMEYTSLDGNPTPSQRLRVAYLRNFKHLTTESIWRPTKFSGAWKDLVKWIATVGLSGVIVYFVTILSQPSVSETENQLKKINYNLNRISRQLDQLQKFGKGTTPLHAKDSTILNVRSK